MPHALLLSPDDQAVTAITGVLEEMSVTCERPLDGVSAAQKINSQSFDLVMVDCENLPAAKLIFDVCRRGKDGNNPVPIAIVDGRAGLPTAFRLGAELILTKPVAKDQARTTIRTAVSRVRKDVPANKVPSPAASVEALAAPSAAASAERAQAAAASVSSQLTSFADPAPSATAPPTALSAPTLKPATPSTVEEIAASADSAPADRKIKPDNFEPQVALPPPDDPVLAELDRAEREAPDSAAAEQNQTVAQQTPAVSKAPASSSSRSSYKHAARKTRGSLVALLLLVLAIGGFYAAWTYQPGFRAVAQPQVDRVLALAGMAHPKPIVPPPPASNAAKRPAPAAVPAPAPPVPNQAQATGTDSQASSATGAANGSPATSAPTTPAAAAAALPAPTPDTTTPKPAGNTIPSVSVVNNSVTTKASAHAPADKKNAAASPSDNELPGEKSAVILSSKGAEKRLAHSVAPKYPVEAKSGDAQGTVVLKEVVDENGKVEGVRLVEGNAALATAAIQAVKQWRYRPYVRDGRAQPFQTVVIVDFQRP
jgi:TonB family protein